MWGAQGGCSWALSGKGGYSFGYQNSNKGFSFYVCCGGAGIGDDGTGDYTADTQNSGGKGGYNGGGDGGKGWQSTAPTYRIRGGGGGGGCTHIASINRKELYNYEKYQNEVLLVAGGGGGSMYGIGGYGGGIFGGSTTYTNGLTNTSFTSEGGTQVTGHMFGKGQQGMDKTIECGYGQEGNGGGGGGWYGGQSKQVQGDGSSVGGGGGSGHVGDVTNGQTIAGNTSFPSPFGETETGHAGNGWTKIGWKL